MVGSRGRRFLMRTAWVRPLKDGGYQYFARDDEGSYVWGSSNTLGDAYGRIGNLLGEDPHCCEIVHRKPYGKWSS